MSKYYNQSINPFGPMMAENTHGSSMWKVLDATGDYASEDEVSIKPTYDILSDDGEIHSYHYQWQSSLDLETVQELEDRLRNQIASMRQAYLSMCHNAMKWHYLMEDVENNEQIKKMFNDLQMIRKLSGSRNV